jgi:hypothetical protein
MLLPVSLTFAGGLYGVHAEVQTSSNFRAATVTLRGPGIDCTGHGTLARDGVVRLDDDFERYLRRRRVTLRAVTLAPDRANISVAVDLPLLGARTVVLRTRDEPRLAQHLGGCE